MQRNPGYFQKLFWCTLLVVLLQVLKKYLDLRLPGSMIFHHYLITLVQLLILLWTIILLLSPSKSVLLKITILLLIVALPELLITYWIHHPEKTPSYFRKTLVNYVTQAEQNIIQYDPPCSIYDSSLFYTLKPSAHFVFSNPEFSDSFHTNSRGLRDDEISLQRPAIICLGDSYAMGWGVEQKETFGEQVEQFTGLKVLNAAVSSYGTARELKNLNRLDTTALQYIIIQYCRNDYTENREFVRNNYALAVSPRSSYDSVRTDHYLNKYWFPGKRLVTVAKLFTEEKVNALLFPQRPTWKDSAAWHLQRAAVYFTEILCHSSINFRKTKVLVADMNEPQSRNNDFIDAVNQLAHSPQYAGCFNDHLRMVPVADLLTTADYYLLDPHIKASGHLKIAKRLAAVIRSF